MLEHNEDSENDVTITGTGWSAMNCMECDAAIGFFPPEIVFEGDEIPVYCFVCATHLSKKGN